MDDHRRGTDGYAPTVAASPSGSVPASRGLAETQLATGTDLQPPPSTERTGPVVGGMIGKYLVATRIGADPIGVVFSARDEANRPVAIKLVHATVAHAPYRTRLVRTAPALAALAHPSLVQIDEIGVAFGRPYIVMEYVEGPLLSVWLERARTWDEIAFVFAEIGAALAAAHRAGFGHGDWTLDCVLVEPSGRPRLIDVGLGRFDPAGNGHVDPRVDQLRFAVALRGALGGGHDGERALWDRVPEPVRAVVARAVDDASPTRFATMSDVVDALDAARGRRSSPAIRGPRAAGSVAAPTLARRGRRLLLGVVGVALVAGAAAAAYALVPPPAPTAAPTPVAATAAVTATPLTVTPLPLPLPLPPAPPTPPTPIVDHATTPIPPPPAPVSTPSRTHAPAAAKSLSPAHPPQVAPPPSPPPPPPPAATAVDPPPFTIEPRVTVPPAPPPPPARTTPGAVIRTVFGALGFGHVADVVDDDAPEPLRRGAYLVSQAAGLRAGGHFGGATAKLKAAISLLDTVDPSAARTQWEITAKLDLGLCALETEDWSGALSWLQPLVPQMNEQDIEYREALLGEGIALWQLDDATSANKLIHIARIRSSGRDLVAAALIRLTGPLGLPPD